MLHYTQPKYCLSICILCDVVSAFFLCMLPQGFPTEQISCTVSATEITEELEKESEQNRAQKRKQESKKEMESSEKDARRAI